MRDSQKLRLPHPDPGRRSRAAGMTLATPFAAATLPYPWLLLSLVVCIPFVVHLARYGLRLPKVKDVPAIVWLVLLLGLLHLCGLRSGPTPYWTRVVADMGIVAAGVCVYLLGREDTDDADTGMVRGFFAALIPFVAVTAIVGLVKAALLERGILLGFILSLYPDQYPPGSSLRADTGLFGLSMLAAGLGLVIVRLSGHRSRTGMACAVLALAVMVSAGMLTESRRFLILSLLIPCVWFAVSFKESLNREFFRRTVIPFAGLLVVVGVLFWLIHTPVPIRTVTVLGLTGTAQIAAPESKDAPPHVSGTGTPKPGPAVRQTDPTTIYRMFGTMGAGQAFGFESRTARWGLGTELLADRAWLTGIGFSYHELFSCRFTGCTFLDYPHFPLLSEWLAGGIAGAMAALAIYALLFRSLWRSGWRGWTTGSSAVAVAVLPYALLSGDTLFSIPQFIIACLLAQSQAETGNASVETGANDLRPARPNP